MNLQQNRKREKSNCEFYEF